MRHKFNSIEVAVAQTKEMKWNAIKAAYKKEREGGWAGSAAKGLQLPWDVAYHLGFAK